MRRERNHLVRVDCQEIRDASERLRGSLVQVFGTDDQNLLPGEDAEPALELPRVLAPRQIAGVLVGITGIRRILQEPSFFAIEPLQFGIKRGGEIECLLPA